MSIPAEAQQKLALLIERAEKDTMLASTKTICAVMKQHGLLYEVKVHSKYVGVHPLNRDGYGVSANAVQALITNVAHIGWDWGAVKALAVEVDETNSEAVHKFNQDLVQSSNGILAPITDRLRFVSLEGSHTNQALRCFHYGCPHPHELLTEGGRLSLPKLTARDPEFATAVGDGLSWQVVAASAIKAFPTLAHVLQAAGNAAGQVAQGEPEAQLLRRVYNSWSTEYAMAAERGHSVDFARVKSRVLASSNSHAELIPYIYAFVLKFCGGHEAELLLESEAFIRHNSTARRLGGPFFQALSLDCKGQPNVSLARIRHALLKFAYMDSEGISRADVTKLLQATDKAFQDKVKDADLLMVDMRAALKNNVMRVRCSQLVHELDIDLVKHLLGRKLAKKYMNVGGIAHDFLCTVENTCSVEMSDIKSKFQADAKLTEEWPVTEPARRVGSADTSQSMMRELDESGRVLNLPALISAKGFLIGTHVKHKKDGVTGVIKAFDVAGSEVTLTMSDSEQLKVPMSDIAHGDWVTVKQKTTPLPTDVSAFLPGASAEYSLHVLRAKVTVALHTVMTENSKDKSLTVFNKPRSVVVNSPFAKGALTLVPCSMKVVLKACDRSQVPSGAVFMGELRPGLQCWLTQQTTLPHESTSSSDKVTEGFVSPYWFVEAASDKDIANLDTALLKVSGIDNLKIPCYKNNKAIKAGDKLVVFQPSGGSKRAATEDDGAAGEQKRRASRKSSR